MKAKQVFEVINFKRGQDPKKSLELGKYRKRYAPIYFEDQEDGYYLMSYIEPDTENPTESIYNFSNGNIYQMTYIRYLPDSFEGIETPPKLTTPGLENYLNNPYNNLKGRNYLYFLAPNDIPFEKAMKEIKIEIKYNT